MHALHQTRWAVIVVLAHAGVAALHGAAHRQLAIGLSQVQNIFVVLVITLAPLLSLVLLWRGFRQAGGWLLAASMLGSLIFGVYYHFVEMSPDHVSQTPTCAWGMVFQITAVVLAHLELCGLGIGG